MNTLRMEKMFKGAGELTNEVTLPEADVMRFVKLEKDFLGKEATIRSQNHALRWTCAYLRIEDNGSEDGIGGEAVMYDRQVVGSIASITYGHTVGYILAFAYVKPSAASPGTNLEVVIAGRLRNACVLAEPAYDATNLLPRTDSA